MARRSDYEEFESSSAANRRLLRQEELILEVTEALAEALQREGITRTQLAARLGRSKGFVSQILAGQRNLTLRTIADVADALRCRIKVRAHREPEALPLVGRETVRYAASWELTGEWSARLLKPVFGKQKERVAA
jgi:transcriptional regulator with XRE-family HTH domain